MYGEKISSQLDKASCLKGTKNGIQMGLQQSFEFIVGNVAGSNEQQTRRLPIDKVVLNEIIILGYDDSLFAFGEFYYLPVGRAIAAGKINRVYSVMSCYLQPHAKSFGQLRINKKPHAANRSIRLTCVSLAA